MGSSRDGNEMGFSIPILRLAASFSSSFLTTTLSSLSITRYPSTDSLSHTLKFIYPSSVYTLFSHYRNLHFPSFLASSRALLFA